MELVCGAHDHKCRRLPRKPCEPPEPFRKRTDQTGLERVVALKSSEHSHLVKLHGASGRRLSHRFNEIGREYRVNWLRLWSIHESNRLYDRRCLVAGLDAATCRKTLRQTTNTWNIMDDSVNGQ